MALGASLFAALLGLALVCRVRRPARGAAVLEFFGIDGDDGTAQGDVLGVAGFAGLVALLASERAGLTVDAMLLVDALLTALGLGLAVAWVVTRARLGSAPTDLVVRDAPRVLYTELDPRLEPAAAGDDREA